MRESWREINNQFNKKSMISIPAILETVNNKRFLLKDDLKIFPANENIFKAFNFFEINETKVVIIGQDPYHGHDQATGLPFAVHPSIKIPPSLKNIIKELKEDLNLDLIDTSLEGWARQGVLMLNASLTVIQGLPSSQMGLWNEYTDYIISELNNQEKIIFLAWGAFAYNKLKSIDIKKHTLLVSSHPSPLGYYQKYKQFSSFKGSKPFSKINKILVEEGKEIINWAPEPH